MEMAWKEVFSCLKKCFLCIGKYFWVWSWGLAKTPSSWCTSGRACLVTVTCTVLVTIVMVTCTVLVISGGHFLVLFILAPVDYVVSLILFFAKALFWCLLCLCHILSVYFYLVMWPYFSSSNFSSTCFWALWCYPLYGSTYLWTVGYCGYAQPDRFCKVFQLVFCLCHKNILWKMQVSKTIPKTWLFNLLRFDFDLLLLCFL